MVCNRAVTTTTTADHSGAFEEESCSYTSKSQSTMSEYRHTLITRPLACRFYVTLNADATNFYLVVDDFKFVGSNGCATFGNPIDCNTVPAVQRRLADLRV